MIDEKTIKHLLHIAEISSQFILDYKKEEEAGRVQESDKGFFTFAQAYVYVVNEFMLPAIKDKDEH